MTPTIPIHDRRFRYTPAATHTSPDAFRARQEARRQAAQNTKVTYIKRVPR